MICNIGSRVVNNFLISYTGGYILVDTGYAGGFPHFKRMLKKCQIKPKEIKYVFLTHAHDDHAGFLNEVLEETGAEVILHPKAIEGLKRGQNSFEGGCSSRLAWLFCKVLTLFGHGDHKYPAIKDKYMNRLITIDSDRFKTLDFPYEIMETPGHTSDHISMMVRNKLFCGDAAMNGFPSLRRTTIWVEDLEQFKRSWEKIIEKNPDMICPAHGKPFKTEDLRKYMKTLERVKLYPLKSGKEI